MTIFLKFLMNKISSITSSLKFYRLSSPSNWVKIRSLVRELAGILNKDMASRLSFGYVIAHFFHHVKTDFSVLMINFALIYLSISSSSDSRVFSLRSRFVMNYEHVIMWTFYDFIFIQISMRSYQETFPDAGTFFNRELAH